MDAVRGRRNPLSAVRSDLELIAQCAAGREEALGLLYDRHASQAYGLARQVVRDVDHAQDVVQEAFLAVWRGAERFDEERATVRTWLLTLVHHKAVDVVRRESVRARPTTERNEQVDAFDVEAHSEQAEDAARIHRALAELSEAQRQVLELVYFNGLTQAEVATRLSKPVGTIKSRKRLALVRLRRELAEHAA